jgi:hypothetical protein
MQLRIPPTAGVGVPIGELVLLLTLLSINYAKLLPKLFSLVFAYPFLVWWGLGIGRALMGVPEYGMWALRDATHVLDSLFLLAGFAFAANSEMVDRFFLWLPKILVVVVIYGATYPFADVLASFSPTIVSGNGKVITILFNYVGTQAFLLVAAAYVLIFHKEIRVSIIRNQPIAITAALWGYTVALFQARTIYLQIIALIVLFAFYRRKLLSRSVLVIVLLLGVLVLLPVLGLQIKGRLGEEVSINFLLDHFLTIGGVSVETGGGNLEGAAEGVNQRYEWWISIYQRLTSDIWHLLYGLGYGFPLTDFSYFGAIVREPHNSYLSILARLGLIGGIAWVWLHALMLSVWHSSYKRCVRMGWHNGQNRLLIFMVYFVLIWVNAIGEDAFEKPFFAIPYYFFWGILLRYVLHLKNGMIGSQGALP